MKNRNINTNRSKTPSSTSKSNNKDVNYNIKNVIKHKDLHHNINDLPVDNNAIVSNNRKHKKLHNDIVNKTFNTNVNTSNTKTTNISIKKENFTNKETFPVIKDQLTGIITDLHQLLNNSDIYIPYQYRDRGWQYLNLLTAFLTSKACKNKLTPELASCILNDLTAIGKRETIYNVFEERLQTYYRMDIKQKYTPVKVPRMPFNLLTFKCYNKSGNYSTTGKDGKLKPMEIRTDLSNHLKALGLPFSGVTEYSLEQENTANGKRWRSVLHYHYIVPLLTVNPNIPKETLTSHGKHLIERMQTINGSGGSWEKIDANISMKKMLNDVLVLTPQIDKIKLNRFWEVLCNGYDLQPEPVHFAHGNASGDQGPNDNKAVDWYLKKQSFMNWKHKNDKMQFYYDERNDRWMLKKYYDAIESYKHDPIQLTELFQHYRNNRLALPSRSRNGICIESHPLHKFLTRHAPPLYLSELYDELFNTHLLKAVKECKDSKAS